MVGIGRLRVWGGKVEGNLERSGRRRRVDSMECMIIVKGMGEIVVWEWVMKNFFWRVWLFRLGGK
jgi:hypothetical protein